ncbi:MAG TPA: hypothetical protein VGH13_21365 [Xanthobacteraceae bacterium]
MKFARGLCLICLCILGTAIVIGIVELVTAPILLKVTGCHGLEILPGVSCGSGGFSFKEFVLNLPFLFLWAAMFFFRTSSPPSREFLLLLYPFKAILVLALTYPLLILFTRTRAR